MQCKICSKMFTPPVNKKITDICSQYDEKTSQNNPEHNKDSFKNSTLVESKKYFNVQMNFYNKQIKNIEETADLSLENTTDFEYEEEAPSTIERLRKYANKPEQISKKNQLENLKKKYPFVKSPFNPVRDRDKLKQFWSLVSTKEMNVAEFVLKWECEHKKRIHKHMAWKLLTERKDKGKISDEFLSKIHEEFEEYYE